MWLEESRIKQICDQVEFIQLRPIEEFPRVMNEKGANCPGGNRTFHFISSNGKNNNNKKKRKGKKKAKAKF